MTLPSIELLTAISNIKNEMKNINWRLVFSLITFNEVSILYKLKNHTPRIRFPCEKILCCQFLLLLPLLSMTSTGRTQLIQVNYCFFFRCREHQRK